MIRKTHVLLCLAAVGTVARAANCDVQFSEVFESVSPSVVRVFTVSVDPSVLLERVQMAVGTGVVVDDDGHFVTNAHVVFDASEILVSTGDDELVPATVVGIDPLTDLAVLELQFPFSNLPPAVLGTSADLRIGESVMAIDIPPGFLVETVEPGSPAEEIGINGGTFPIVLAGEEYLLGGDMLLSVNGEPLMDIETVSEIAMSLEVGATIELEYLHEGEIVTTQVELPERPLLPSDVQRFRQRRSIQ